MSGFSTGQKTQSLIHAVKYCKLEEAKTLISKDPNIVNSQEDDSKMTALMYAATFKTRKR